MVGGEQAKARNKISATLREIILRDAKRILMTFIDTHPKISGIIIQRSCEITVDRLEFCHFSRAILRYDEL